MKFLIFALTTTLSIAASAAPKIINVRDMKMAPTDSFSGPLLVGRISPFTMQVELTGMLVTDPDHPLRKVKATIDLTPADPTDNDQVQAAMMALGKFYDAKRGRTEGCDNGGGGGPKVMTGCIPGPVSKTIAIMYDTAAVKNDSVTCLGKDLEIAEPAPDALVKKCFKVAPLDIIEYSL